MKKSQPNIDFKKIELIEWLARLRDESIIQQIEAVRLDSLENLYDRRMPGNTEELKAKLTKSNSDVQKGRLHSQQEVESYFRSKINRD